MKNLFQMMSTPKKDSLFDGIQGYQDGGLLNMMPSPNEEDIINVNYFGQPQKELEGLATEAFGRERNPLAQMLMRSESAAQAGDERRAAEAVERSRMGYAQDYMSDDAPLDIKRSLMGQFMPEAVSAPDIPEDRGLANIAKYIPKGTPDIDLSSDKLALANVFLNPEKFLDGTTPDDIKKSKLDYLDTAAVTPEMKRPALNDMLLGSLIGAGRSGALAAGQGIKKGIDLAGEGIGAAGTGIGYGIKGTGKLLSALAGIPGDIAKAYQSYGEGERYPALAQLMSASQGKIMPNIYAGLYADGGEIKGYPIGGVVEGDDDPYGLGNINPGNPWAGWSAGNPPPAPSTPGAPPAPGTTYQSGQPMGSQDYMGSDVSYGSMFGVDTGAASSLDQALSNLGYELTPEQRKMYEEYDIGTAEKDIRLGGQRGLLGLTQQRQQQSAGSGFAGGGGGSAAGTARRDLLQDISMQQRGRRQDYQEGIASQIASDIANEANIKEIGQESNQPDLVYGNFDAPPLDDPSWNPPPSTNPGSPYIFNGSTFIWDGAHWVTEEQYESDMDDYYDTDG